MGRARHRLTRVAAHPIGLVLVVLVVWEILARTVLESRYALAAPTSIVAEIRRNPTLYTENLRHTSWNAVQAFIWGNVVALALAAFVIVAPRVRPLVVAVTLTVSCLPLVALAPILRVLLGRGESTPITLGALAVLYTSLAAGVLGLRAASPSTIDVVRAGGRGGWFALHAVRVPSAVPFVFSGLQISAPAAFLGALVGEFTGSSKGLGLLVIRALASLDPDRVWAVAVLSTIITTTVYFGLGWVAQRLTPWSAQVSTSNPTPVAPRTPARAVTLAVGRSLVSCVVVLLAWVLLLRVSGLNRYFAKGPLDVWRYLFSEPNAREQRTQLFDALRDTMITASLGFALGLAGGVALAGVLVAVAPLRRVLLPIAIALRSVPIVATTPLLILMFGRGRFGAVVIVAVLSFFPTLATCVNAMQRVPGQIDDVMRAYNASGVTLFLRSRLPAAVPAIAASARIAVPASLLGATVAEWLATGRGMGNLMTVSSGTAQYDTLWACVAVLTIVAVATHAVMSALESIALARFAPEQRA